MSDNECDLGEWCAEHREFYTDEIPCPGCTVKREAFDKGFKEGAEHMIRSLLRGVSPQCRKELMEMARRIQQGTIERGRRRRRNDNDKG